MFPLLSPTVRELSDYMMRRGGGLTWGEKARVVYLGAYFWSLVCCGLNLCRHFALPRRSQSYGRVI